jgi:hypothetical protein
VYNEQNRERKVMELSQITKGELEETIPRRRMERTSEM